MSVKETVESAEWKPVEVRPHELISERAQGAVKMQLASDLCETCQDDTVALCRA